MKTSSKEGKSVFLEYKQQALTISFAAVIHQQFDNAQKAFSWGQVERPVPYLSTRIDISPKLYKKLAHLSRKRKKKKDHEQGTK